MNGETRFAVSLGMFDGVHLGHRAVIEKARAAAEKMGVRSAAFTFVGVPELPKFEGRRDMLLMQYEDKLSALVEAGAGDVYAQPFGEVCAMSCEQFFETVVIGKMNAACVVCGDDFRFGKDRAGDTAVLAALCERAGIGLETVAPVCVDGEPVSSSRIRELIRNGDMLSAKRLLGHEHYCTLPVIGGNRLGRTIGFPTANSELPSYLVRPKRGVYASAVRIGDDDRLLPAVTNIGIKPTVKDDDAENMETHIIGFDGDLYGKKIRVYLKAFIREERKFGSLAELKVQLEDDRKKAITAFS